MQLREKKVKMSEVYPDNEVLLTKKYVRSKEIVKKFFSSINSNDSFSIKTKAKKKVLNNRIRFTEAYNK
jgi:hypothetical protein